MEGIQTAAFLRAHVNKYLTGNVLDSAKFYAERLYYEAPSADSLYLLALCYFRSGKYKQTYLILQDCIRSSTTGASLNKYLFALACNELDRLEEGEQALSPHKHKTVDSITLEAVSATPGGAEGVYLLGKLCRRQHRKEMAVMYYKLSLKMDPYLWSAITELSEMGVAINVKELYPGYSDSHEQASSRSVFDDAKNGEESRPFQARLPGALEEKAGWLSDVKQASTERYYSNGGVFCDSKAGTSDKLRSYSTAELLSSGGGYGFGDHGASPKVSMSIGMSSMSLHVPFASPASMPSPTPGSMSMGMMNPYTASQMKPRKAAMAPASAGGAPVSEDSNYSSSEPFDMTMTMNMSDSGDSSRFFARNRSNSYDQDAEGDNRHLQGARTALFGMGTPGLTPISNANNETGITPAMRNLNTTNARSALHTGVSTGNVNGVVGVDLFGSSAPNTNHASGSVGPGAGAGSRRVSFGPTARLSFSGALDGAAMGAQSAHLRQLHGDDSSFGQSGLLTSVDMEDDYPYKLPRQNELDGSTSPAQTSAHRTAEDSNRALPRKLLLSPFPMESSPILPQLGAAQPVGAADGLPSPTFRRKLGARHSTGGQHAGSGTAGIALSSEGAGSSQVSHGEEVDKENGNSENPRYVHYHHPPTHAPHEHLAHSRALAPTSAVDKLVATLARAYQMLCLYCCRACIDELHSLPERHYRSALVSQWIGKAYYEMNEYKPAMLAFREMLRAEPFRLCGLETLSTALWHLKRDKELCTLAQQVVEVDKLSPEAWCVVGNCFSLQREPDTAIKFFQRAIQLDPSFTYAHTLSGHEQVNNEDLEKAVESFRQALLYNDRHYNAWYGLGTIYYRQEKFELAEYHFRKALSINPVSSVLHCYLGECVFSVLRQILTSHFLLPFEDVLLAIMYSLSLFLLVSPHQAWLCTRRTTR